MPHPAPDRRDHEVLLKTTLDDAVKGLAAGRPRAARAAFRLGLMPLARRFRREIEDADELIGRLGLAAGADRLLRVYSGPVAYSGLERIPAEGALVVVANHPGTVDTPALMASLAVRRDLKVLALTGRSCAPSPISPRTCSTSGVGRPPRQPRPAGG